MHFTDYELV